MDIIKHAVNGIDLYYAPNPAMQQFYIGIYVKAGALYESDDRAGYAHLLEHVVFRNIKKRYGEDFYALLTRHSLYFDAATYKEMILFSFTGLRRGLGFALELIRALSDDIDVSSEELRAEKSRIKAEIAEDDIRSRLSYQCGRKVWENTPLKNPVTGHVANITRATCDTINSYKNSVMVRGNLYAVATGHLSEDDLLSVEAALGSLTLCEGAVKDNTAVVPEHFMKRGCTITAREKNYTGLDFSFDYDNAAENYFIIDRLYDILLTGYDSLIEQELSERRGLIYSTDAFIERYHNIGVLNFRFDVDSAHLEEAIEAVVAILNRVKRGEFDWETSLQKRVNYSLEELDNIEGHNFSLAFQHLIFGRCLSVDEDLAVYRSVSREDIAAFARELFATDRLTLGIAGSKSTVKQNKNKLRVLLQKLDR